MIQFLNEFGFYWKVYNEIKCIWYCCIHLLLEGWYLVNFASVRIITDDVDRLVKFYEKVMGLSAERPAPVFAELVAASCTLAIGHSQTVPLFGEGSAVAADNHSIIIEFLVHDVDAEYERLKPFIEEWVKEPTTMPWGNRAILFRDPDGNLVNLFSPVTEEAIKRFTGRT